MIMLLPTITFLGLLVVVPTGINTATVPNATVNVLARSPGQSICPNEYAGLDEEESFLFSFYIQAERKNLPLKKPSSLQCENSTLCEEIDHTSTIANCDPVKAGAEQLSCRLNIPEDKYYIVTNRVDCEPHPYTKTCMLKGSCVLYYVPGLSGSNLVLYLVIAGIVALVVVAAGVGYFVYDRKFKGERVSTSER